MTHMGPLHETAVVTVYRGEYSEYWLLGILWSIFWSMGVCEPTMRGIFWKEFVVLSCRVVVAGRSGSCDVGSFVGKKLCIRFMHQD